MYVIILLLERIMLQNRFEEDMEPEFCMSLGSCSHFLLAHVVHEVHMALILALALGNWLSLKQLDSNSSARIKKSCRQACNKWT